MEDESYEEVTCPFCKENDFDLIGLKSHINHGDCSVFNETRDIERI